MTNSPITSLWPDLWSDLRNPDFIWQLAAVALCAIAGWAIARLLRARIEGRELHLGVVQIGMESFARVLPPLLTLFLIVLVKPVLARWHHVNLLRLAIPLVASFALIRLTFYLLRRVFARGGEAGSFILTFERVFAALVWLGFASYITGLWPDIGQFLDETAISTGRYKITLLTVLQAALSVGVTLILALWVGALLEERLMKIDTVHSSVRTVMARMGRAVLVLIAVLVSLSMVGIDLTVLSVFGGALGVGIGLGLQKIVGSYVSGFVILIERSLAVGDMVAVDRYQGTVTRINTRYTILMASDGVESVIPNEMLVSGPVQNFSLSNRSLRLSTQVTVGYEHDIEAVLEMLEQAVVSVERVSKEPAPVAMLMRFGADGLEIEVGFWISDPENGKGGVLSDVNRAIWRALKQHDISLPYPQREIRIVEKPVI